MKAGIAAPSPLRIDGVFEVFPDVRREWRWRLKSRNRRIVAVSESYGSRANAMRSAKAVQRICGGVTMILTEKN